MRQCHSFQWWLKKQNKKVYVLHDVKNDIQRRRRSLRGCKQTNNAKDIKKTWCHCTKYHHHHQISLSSYHRHHHVVQNVMCERIKVIWNIWKTPCLVCVFSSFDWRVFLFVIVIPVCVFTVFVSLPLLCLSESIAKKKILCAKIVYTPEHFRCIFVWRHFWLLSLNDFEDTERRLQRDLKHKTIVQTKWHSCVWRRRVSLLTLLENRDVFSNCSLTTYHLFCSSCALKHFVKTQFGKLVGMPWTIWDGLFLIGLRVSPEAFPKQSSDKEEWKERPKIMCDLKS